MKLSAQEEYGLRCLLRLGYAGPGGSLTLTELSLAEGISVANVAKMMRVLRRAGFVTSTRGKDGGYTLARVPEEINVGDALAVLGGRLFDSRFCDRHAGVGDACTHVVDCSIRSVWRLLQQAVDGVLARLTLRDLLRGEGAMDAQPPRSRMFPVVSMDTGTGGAGRR
jgi:Rrf2 family protein